ncbi:DUF429 domain-containing protein [Thermoleophilia bacterium SCSIO 60948]|nr:DUF429 domain-containing protein [Thermoleophilia bacterium SCSIO 60948]
MSWRGGRPAVEHLIVGCNDAELVALARGRRKVGIDAPLGWPLELHEALADHAAGRAWSRPTSTRADRNRLAMRNTDFEVQRRTGRKPLMVGADWIALVAFRAAALCRRLGEETGRDIDRSGMRGLVCETYPAGLLHLSGEHPGGYGHAVAAGARRERRELILGALERREGLVVGAAGREEVVAADRSDRLDAVICALLAGMVAEGRTVGPPDELAAAAEVEGWIHLPRDAG